MFLTYLIDKGVWFDDHLTEIALDSDIPPSLWYPRVRHRPTGGMLGSIPGKPATGLIVRGAGTCVYLFYLMHTISKVIF